MIDIVVVFPSTCMYRPNKQNLVYWLDPVPSVVNQSVPQKSSSGQEMTLEQESHGWLIHGRVIRRSGDWTKRYTDNIIYWEGGR